MWIEKITFLFYGDNFSPNKFLSEITEPVLIELQNEATDANDADPTGRYGFGGLHFQGPQKYGVPSINLSEYESWYVDFLDRHGELIRAHRIDDIRLFVDVYHDDGQLNTEVFSRDGIKTLSKFNAAIPLSYYRLDRVQMIEMLNESDLSPAQVEEYVALHPIGT